MRTKRFNEGGSIIARRLRPGVKGLRGFVGGFEGSAGTLEAMTNRTRPVRRGIVSARYGAGLKWQRTCRLVSRMRPTRKERAIAALSREIQDIEDAKRRENYLQSIMDCRPAAMNETEREFSRRAKGKGLSVIRSGWPDFLLVDPVTGKTFAVEVKRPADPVRPNQARMFAALDAGGIPVYVWNPALARLTPWKDYVMREFDRSHRVQR